MENRTSYTYPLSLPQQATLKELLRTGNYRPATVPHTLIAVTAPDYNVSLFKSGKCLIQGKGATDFVTFILEPLVLGAAQLGYEKILNPESIQPHLGIDESGKGDFFGPLVVAGAYVDESLADAMRKMNVRDSKTITSDNKMLDMGRELRRLLGRRFTLIRIGPETYNRLYAKMRSVNTLLAWAHARAIENLLEVLPDCPRAISDQFGSKEQVERALMGKGRKIELIQRHRAESDLAVAAASILAREEFLRSLIAMEKDYGIKIPKGASAAVKTAAVQVVKKLGPQSLLKAAKCHFRTTDQVLEQAGSSRKDLGPEGQIVSKTFAAGHFSKRSSRSKIAE